MMNTDLSYELAQLLGDRFTTSEHEQRQHGKDESSLRPMPPVAVCYALTTEEVASIVQHCHQHHTPVIPFGAVSSLEGHIFAPQGRVSINLTRMNQILRVSADDLDCTVQAADAEDPLQLFGKGHGLEVTAEHQS
jgi:D-lactate dehydrogenase (cytochrome)